MFVASLGIWFLGKSYRKYKGKYEKEIARNMFIFMIVSEVVLLFRLIEDLGYTFFGFLFFLTGAINFLYLIYRLFDLSTRELDSEKRSHRTGGDKVDNK